MGPLLPAPGCNVRFGVFDLDQRSGELRKNGLKVKLQKQPFQILALLLERPGDVVTREDLYRRLWPAGTFVDFEHSLNAAIKKLRLALEDPAESPRFIETLARRGYRFIAVVEVTKPEGVAAKAETPVGLQPPRWLWAGVVVALISVSVAWWRFHRSTAGLKISPFTAFTGQKAQPAFSPDGRQLAFVWNGENQDNYDIYVKWVDTGSPVRLTTNPAVDLDPAWSPDGRWIAFRRILKTTTEIMIIPALGGAERKLTQTGPRYFGSSLILGNKTGLSWSPDGKFLVAVDRDSLEGSARIISVSATTGEKRDVTAPGIQYNDIFPVISSDGRSVAFVRYRKPGDRNINIYLQSLGPGGTPMGEPKRLTRDLRGVSGLDWTPSGRSLVFSGPGEYRGLSDTYTTGGLWRIPVTGGTPEPLSAVGEPMMSLAVSRKGDRLAYTRDPRPDHNIYEIGLIDSKSGNNMPRLFLSSTENDYSPQFSPDGKKIALVSARSGPLEIWACMSDGSNCSPVTSFGGPEVGSPKWSPDSRKIALDTIKNGQWDIYTVDLDGGPPLRLTNESSNAARPSWSSDGQWIYFASDRSGRWQVWKAPSKGGAAVQVTRNGGFEADETSDGEFIFYVKRDRRGIWRVPARGGQELQALEEGAEGQWCLTEKGIYLLRREPVRGFQIQLFSFATGGVSGIIALPPSAAGLVYNPYIPALTISPDYRRALFTQIDHSETDIIMVENFRY